MEPDFPFPKGGLIKEGPMCLTSEIKSFYKSVCNDIELKETCQEKDRPFSQSVFLTSNQEKFQKYLLTSPSL